MSEGPANQPSEAILEGVLASLPPTLKCESPDARELLPDLQFVAALLGEVTDSIREPSVIYRDAEKRVRLHPIGNGITAGRAPDCELSFPGWRDLSRRHFKIVGDGGNFVLTDIGSANGTFVRGVKSRITSRDLRTGDIIEAGLLTFVFIRPD